MARGFFRPRPFQLFKITLAALFLFWVLKPAGPDRQLAVYVITAEAADQSFWGMTAVGEVIRNRGKIEGFSVLKKDLPAFFKQQPASVRRCAAMAWSFSRWTNLSGKATHFENVKQFGPPPWEEEMRKTARIDDLQFYRRK